MSTTTAVANTWVIDPAHSRAEFKVKHMMISNVKGSFSGVSGTLAEYALQPSLGHVDAAIDISTLNTGDDKRDAHLKSADFFAVESYPQMTLKSTDIKKISAQEFSVTGDLTLHGVTKAVTFAVDGASEPTKDPWGNTRIGLSATSKINRKDFGLVWKAALESGGVLVGEDVQISLDVQFLKS